MRNIYASKLSFLQQAKKGKRKDLLVEEVRRMAKQVNQRFYRLEKAGKGVNDTAYQYAQRETGKLKPRFTVNTNKLQNMTISDLYDLGLEIDAKIRSRTSTLTGLAEVERNRLDFSARKLEQLSGYLEGTGVSRDTLKSFFEYGGAEFINSRYLDSTQLIEDFVKFTQEGNVSVKQFMRELKRYKDVASIDYGKVTRSWQRIDAKRKK